MSKPAERAGSSLAPIYGYFLIIALLLGFLSDLRPAITMVAGIFRVHFVNGLLLSNKGYQFALALLAA